jgi:hypothetical protein
MRRIGVLLFAAEDRAAINPFLSGAATSHPEFGGLSSHHGGLTGVCGGIAFRPWVRTAELVCFVRWTTNLARFSNALPQRIRRFVFLGTTDPSAGRRGRILCGVLKTR